MSPTIRQPAALDWTLARMASHRVLDFSTLPLPRAWGQRIFEIARYWEAGTRGGSEITKGRRAQDERRPR